ncbi:hypothetical protein [Azospirillum doebereinerae]
MRRAATRRPRVRRPNAPPRRKRRPPPASATPNTPPMGEGHRPDVRTGHANTGHANTGHANTGHANTGGRRPPWLATIGRQNGWRRGTTGASGRAATAAPTSASARTSATA